MSRTSVPYRAFQSAIVQDQRGNPKFVNSQPLPQLVAGTVLVKTAAVALNPSDHKMGLNFPTPGAVVGIDFAGTVVASKSAHRGVSQQ
jgi:NADPH:quinone reductase-like Zn-dependent oxidoreductase